MNLKRIRAAAVLFAAASLGAPVLAGDATVAKPADVRDLMSVSQFHQAGFDKLTSDELSAFNAWFSGNLMKSVPPSALKSKDVRDLMSVNQFHQAGLDKLTPDELAALNASLGAGLSKSVTPVAAAPVAAAPAAVTQPAPSSASFGKEMLAPQDTASPEMITTRISGLFLGWRGDTVIKFDNGQVWQQSEPGIFDTRMQNPEVVIKKLRFGYLLTLPGRSETVFIRRVH